MPYGRRRPSLRNGVWKLRGGSREVGVEVLLPVVEDGLEEVVGSGGLAVEVSGIQQNKLFSQSSASSQR